MTLCVVCAERPASHACAMCLPCARSYDAHIASPRYDGTTLSILAWAAKKARRELLAAQRRRREAYGLSADARRSRKVREP